MKYTIAILLLTLFSGFSSINPERRFLSEYEIVEGKKIGQIKLGMTLEVADSILNSKSEKINWSNYSFEYKYREEGISLWTKQDDENQKIFSVSINPKKRKGKTSAGLMINETLIIEDVIKVYGKPEWGYTEDCSELDAEYSKLGIYFSVDTISGICDETTIDHDSLFYSKAVIEITIGEIDTDY